MATFYANMTARKATFDVEVEPNEFGGYEVRTAVRLDWVVCEQTTLVPFKGKPLTPDGMQEAIARTCERAYRAIRAPRTKCRPAACNNVARLAVQDVMEAIAVATINGQIPSGLLHSDEGFSAALAYLAQ